MSTKHLDWAKNYINWKETDWENVRFMYSFVIRPVLCVSFSLISVLKNLYITIPAPRSFSAMNQVSPFRKKLFENSNNIRCYGISLF